MFMKAGNQYFLMSGVTYLHLPEVEGEWGRVTVGEKSFDIRPQDVKEAREFMEDLLASHRKPEVPAAV